jgi:hypothetical protein
MWHCVDLVWSDILEKPIASNPQILHTAFSIIAHYHVHGHKSIKYKFMKGKR